MLEFFSFFHSIECIALCWSLFGCDSSSYFFIGTYFCHIDIFLMSKFLPFQIENEYGYYESSYGDAGKRYALWAAKMALSQNTGVPWIMCQQWDVPAPVVRTVGLWKVETNSFCGLGDGF